MIDISNKIQQSVVAVFDAVQSAAQKEGVSFFVVGATARDMMLRLTYQLPVHRATRDIDIAIRVADWSEYNKLVDTLIATGEFKRVNPGHRIVFNEIEIIDIIPFGEIAGRKKTVAWPPNEDHVMGVLGFEDAFRAAILVTLRQQPRLDIRVSTLAGLATMKLISWDEAYPARGKDGQDFHLIAETYIDAGNDERMYDEASDLMRVEIFDRAVAGARLLGRDMSNLADDEAHRRIDKILVRESDPRGPLRLISDIVGVNITMQEKFDEILGLINSVRVGFLDHPKRS